MTNWRVREYRPSDEECVVSLWLRSYCESGYGVWRGAHVAGSKDRSDFWAEQRCTAMGLIEACGVDMLVDIEDDDAILAFACQTAQHVHFAVAKFRFREHRRTMLEALLDGALKAPRLFSHEMPDLQAAGVQIPESWKYDSMILAPTILGHYKP
jgi:hypothetical protein